jgi:hypothetical protein
MKRLGLSLFPVFAILAFAGTVSAQSVGDSSVYFLTYFSNANTPSAPDQTVSIINDGDTQTNLWASFYVFDDSSELEECCSCRISPDGIISESVNRQLTSNTFSARSEISRGVIKIISSSVAAGGPNNYTNSLAPGLRAWSTHIQLTNTGESGFQITEARAADANLGSTQKENLEILCMYMNVLGGGYGVCGCSPEASRR